MRDDAARPVRTRGDARDGGRDETLQRTLFDDEGWGHGPLAPAPACGAPLPGPGLPSAPVLPQRRQGTAPAMPDRLPAGQVASPSTGEALRRIQLRDQVVAYRLRRTRRRSIGFSVGADGLTVAAPHWVGAAQIEAALRDKAAWVLRKLADQRERAARLQASRIEWRDGATLPFLGRTVRIVLDAGVHGVMLDAAAATAGWLPAGAAEVVAPTAAARAPARTAAMATPVAPAAPAAVAAPAPAGAAAAGTAAVDGIDPAALRIGLPASAGPAQIRDAVQSWLQRQARRLFEERCAHYAPRLGVRMRRLALSSAQTRWGSASADGSVRLNWRLVHFSLPTIDYVVAHELAHLRHMDHSPQFWAVVCSVVPDIAQARGTLKRAVLPAFDD